MGAGIPNRGWPPHNKGKLVSDTTPQTGTWYAIGVLNPGMPATPAWVTTTGAVTGTWVAITAMSGTVFSTLTELSATRTGTIGSVAFPAGATIYGMFTNFTLTSGSVRAAGPKIPFATLTDTALTRQGSFGSAAFDTGAIIYGAITNFTLNNGAVVVAFDDKAVTSGNET